MRAFLTRWIPLLFPVVIIGVLAAPLYITPSRGRGIRRTSYAHAYRRV